MCRDVTEIGVYQGYSKIVKLNAFSFEYSLFLVGWKGTTGIRSCS